MLMLVKPKTNLSAVTEERESLGVYDEDLRFYAWRGYPRGSSQSDYSNGTLCRALVDTGSTISLVGPGTLPGMSGRRLQVWKPTKVHITTVTDDQFLLANIQDSSIIGLDTRPNGRLWWTYPELHSTWVLRL